jgi:DNA-binding IclR family transcriptional regulator
MASKPPRKTAPSYSVPALEKGLDIIESLAASPAPLSLAELARDLNRGSAEIFRMLVCLERRSYLRREPNSGKYALTLRLFELAQAHSPLKALLTVARDPMRAVTEALGESCHLSVIERDRLLVIAREESPERVRLAIEVGASFDPKNTASGRLLLDASLKSVTARDETIEGVDDAVVRIGRPDGAVHAALAVSWLRSRKGAKKPAAVLAALRSAAHAIHQSLGIQTGNPN